jgi:hypothetical protein
MTAGAGKENMPTDGQSYPPGEMGCWIDVMTIPGASLLKAGNHSMWIKVPGLGVDLVIGSVYVHNHHRLAALQECEDYVKKFGSLGLVVWGGDMNARLGGNADSTVNHYGKQTKKLVDSLGYEVVNLHDNLCEGEFSRVEYTLNGVDRSTIDYVFVPKGELHWVVKLKICENSGLDSDHRPVALRLRWASKGEHKVKQHRRGEHLKYCVDSMYPNAWDRFENLLDVNMVDWLAKVEDLEEALDASDWISQTVADVLERT